MKHHQARHSHLRKKSTMLLEKYGRTNVRERHIHTAQLQTSMLSTNEKTFRKC